jgi:hypothetical protein
MQLKNFRLKDGTINVVSTRIDNREPVGEVYRKTSEESIEEIEISDEDSPPQIDHLGQTPWLTFKYASIMNNSYMGLQVLPTTVIFRKLLFEAMGMNKHFFPILIDRSTSHQTI